MQRLYCADVVRQVSVCRSWEFNGNTKTGRSSSTSLAPAVCSAAGRRLMAARGARGGSAREISRNERSRVAMGARRHGQRKGGTNCGRPFSRPIICALFSQFLEGQSG